jgi:telomere length regulation protein
MLNALALGARELASMTVPSLAMSPAARERINFPSKMLSPQLHRKLIGFQEQVVQGLIEDITYPSIQKRNVPEVDGETGIVRERQLRVRRPPKITEVKATDVVSLGLKNARPVKVAFAEVAAEFFIIPLINRFWLFLRDEQTREERTVHHELLHRYRGGGTGLILNPMILRHFLATLAVLVHASQNAPQWLAFIAPDTLELALTLGTRPVSHGDTEEEDQGSDNSELGKNEASILTAALELIIVILNGSMELDGGRTLCLDHTTLLLGTREWAGEVFSLLEKGSLVKGGGGDLEIKLRKASAEVLLKLEEVSSKWGRSMVDTR